ncbi:MAG: peptidylprolyl isomerase [Gammaproteobacteria bacterium]
MYIYKIKHFNFALSKALICILITFICVTNIHAKLLDRIVAVVENDVIMESELRQRVSVLVKQFEGRPEALPPQDILVDQVLQRLIVERLQLQLAEQRGIQVDDLSLDQTMRNLAKRNRVTLEQFRETLLKQGIDYIAYREQVRNEMLLDQLRRRTIDSGIQISESEVEELVTKANKDLLKKEYEYHIAHILIAVPQNPKPGQIERAQHRASLVFDRAKSGNNFAKLAIAASDAQDALQGGDLGWRNTAQLPEVFLQQINTMQVGDISKIGQSVAGYHIFKMLDRREIENTMVNQVLARHILIRTNALLSDEAAKRKLKNLKRRIENGDEFEALARANSDDTGSAVNGGNLDWAVSSNFVPKFQEVVDSLEPNTISEPFKSRFGWHIVEVLDTRKHDNSQEAMRAEAREQIRQRKIEEATELWLRQLRDESYIENRLHTSN